MMISLQCNELFKDRVVGEGNEIGLYWDLRSSKLVFKLLSQVGSQWKGPLIQDQKQHNVIVFGLVLLFHIIVLIEYKIMNWNS